MSDRASYSYFIEENGDIIATAPMDSMKEVRVGVVAPNFYSNYEQHQAIAHLANLATRIAPNVVIVFDDGTSPFPGNAPEDYPLSEFCPT